MKSLRFFLDWSLNCQFAGLVWAQRTGLYRAGGLDVDLVQPAASATGSVLESVLHDPGSAGCMEDNLIVRACVSGHPIRAIGAMLQDTPMVLMTPADTTIRALADLAGRRVAMHKDGVHLLETVMTLHGADPQATDIVVDGWTLRDLIDGRFDAVQGYSITEPAVLRAAAFEPRLLPVSHPHLQPYAQMMFATVQSIDEHTEHLETFVRATFVGWQQVFQDVAKAGRLVAMASDEHPDTDANIAIISAMHALVFGECEGSRLGVMERARWQRNLSTYTAFGMADQCPRVEDVIDERFVS